MTDENREDQPEEPSADELLARLRANMDQARGTLVEIAAALGTYRVALLEASLEPHEVLALLLGMQSLLVTGSNDV